MYKYNYKKLIFKILEHPMVIGQLFLQYGIYHLIVRKK